MPYENREEISQSSFDFELVISIDQNDVLGSAEELSLRIHLNLGMMR